MRIRIPYHATRFRYRARTGQKDLLCPLDPLLRDKLEKLHAVFLLENTTQMLRSHFQIIRYPLQGDLLKRMVLQVLIYPVKQRIGLTMSIAAGKLHEYREEPGPDLPGGGTTPRFLEKVAPDR